MLSDGRVLGQSLEKVGCRACGLIRHRTPLGADAVAAIYAEGYGLPSNARQADEARGEAYARVVLEVLADLDRLDRVLDVGCGSGATARALAALLPLRSVHGVDPALPGEVAGTRGRVTLARGLLGDFGGPAWQGFDAVVSVNTIEHTPDPVGFLTEIASRLRPGGRVVVICPIASPANNELLFFDHLWTISPAAFDAFARAAGLVTRRADALPVPIAGFQIFVLDRGPGRAAVATATDPEEAAAYLAAWRRLDADWCDRLGATGRPVQIFGAGQMAAVVRAYAPRSWAQAARLVVDNPADAWDLGRVEHYDPADHARGYRTLVAVHPASKAAVAARIARDGGEPVVMPDAIGH